MDQEHHAGLDLEANAGIGEAERHRLEAGAFVLESQVAVSLPRNLAIRDLALDPDILQARLVGKDLLEELGQVTDAQDIHGVPPAARGTCITMRPRTPLTKRPASSPPKVLASSIDSFIAAFTGTSGQKSSS